jgi:4-amino-4-deoxy-L-arabinose transferase-like glycosyltransferase
MQHNDDERPIESPSRSPLRGGDYSLSFVLLATVGFFIARIPVLVHRVFDPDEFQHSHAAWCVFKGMVLYKDFFEHHTPWYYYVLSPLFHAFDVAGSFESARHFLLFARGLSLVLTIVSVVLVMRIGRLLEDRRVGLLAGLFVVSQPVFFHKTIEIRPDVLALPFYLGGLCFLLRGLATSGDRARRSLGYFLAGGLSVGAAIMCTQKMLFVLPGVLAGLGIWALFARTNAGPCSRILSVLATLLGIAVPAALTCGAFSLQHAGDQFIGNNFLINANWKHVAGEQLIRVLKSSWPVLILSLLGATVSLYRFIRSEQRPYGGILLLCTLFGLMAGILVIPAAHRQYYLMLLPIACLFAAQGLSFLIERARERVRAWLLVLATLPLLVLPVLDLLDSFSSPNDAQLVRLRYVFESTKPTDLVMDGWQGTGVFRPHAFFYYFLHEESVPMLPRERVEAYVDALESGKIRPRLIAMDENLPLLGSRFLRFVMSQLHQPRWLLLRRESRL